MPTLRIGLDTQVPIDLVVESNAILGKKGSGKTNSLIVLLEETYGAGVPVVSIDPKGDHWGIRSGASGEPNAGLSIPVFGGLHGDIPLEPTAGEFIADIVRERGLSVILDVSEFSTAERRRFLTAFVTHLYRRPERESMHLFLEEAHEYIPQRVDSGDAAMVGAFERIVKMGRFKGIGVTMASQRSASLNKNVLTQVDNLFMLRMLSPQDRAAVRAWIDIHAESSSIIDSLPSLQTGEAWLWQPERGEPIHFRFRQRSTYDAGATPRPGEKPKPQATLADIDLGEVQALMAETIERAKAEDPKVLRSRIRELEAALAKAQAAQETQIVETQVPVEVKVPVLTQEDLAALDAASALSDRIDLLRETVESVRSEQVQIIKNTVNARPNKIPEQRAATPALRPALSRPERADGDPVKFRAGAQRMIESLGRMYPLRLTKAQWGMVAKMKTTSGTWSTYLGELRRAGFIDENSAGFTLTESGFEYIGGAPDPMTAEELQQHYRTILRAGAVRMLDVIMESYPAPVDRETLGEKIEMSTASGTFSTYLGELVRNGLAERVDGGLVATDILMHGAAA